MTIEKSAYFRLCPSCGAHGNIVCSDGMQVGCFSVRSAEEAAATLERVGKVTSDEMPELQRQIEGAQLPLHADAEIYVCVPQSNPAGFTIYSWDDPPWEGGTPIDQLLEEQVN